MAEQFSLEDLRGVLGDLPTEYGGAVLENIDKLMAQQEKGATERILGEQENLGILKSGFTARRLGEEVLGPGIERRRGALLGLAGQGLGEKRQERLIGEERTAQTEARREAFKFRLQELQHQLDNQKQLIRLQAHLEGGAGGGDDGGWAETGFGVLGTVVGSMGGPLGAMAGAYLGKKVGGLFGGKKKRSATSGLPGYGGEDDLSSEEQMGYNDLLGA